MAEVTTRDVWFLAVVLIFIPLTGKNDIVTSVSSGCRSPAIFSDIVGTVEISSPSCTVYLTNADGLSKYELSFNLRTRNTVQSDRLFI